MTPWKRPGPAKVAEMRQRPPRARRSRRARAPRTASREGAEQVGEVGADSVRGREVAHPVHAVDRTGLPDGERAVEVLGGEPVEVLADDLFAPFLRADFVFVSASAMAAI